MDKALDFKEYLKLADLFFTYGWVGKALELYQAIAANGYPIDQAKLAELTVVNLEQAENLPELEGHEHLAVINPGLLSTLHFTRELTEYQKRVAFRAAFGLSMSRPPANATGAVIIVRTASMTGCRATLSCRMPFSTGSSRTWPRSTIPERCISTAKKSR